MKSYSTEELQSMSLGSIMVIFEDAIQDCVKDYILDLEKAGLIKNATKMLSHLRDESNALLRLHWDWKKK